MNIKLLAAGAALALGLGLAAAAGADTPVVTLDDLVGTQLGNGPFTLGFEFQANANLQVTQLGAFDDSQNGLSESHDVGLWDSAGNLLAMTTIGSGTSGTLINQFRYNSITPVSLTSGQDYFVGAVWLDGTDPMVFNATNLASSPLASYLSAAYVPTGTLTFPKNLFTDRGYFGPNLTIVGKVPEPATWAMMLVGFGALGAGLRLTRRTAPALA